MIKLLKVLAIDRNMLNDEVSEWSNWNDKQFTNDAFDMLKLCKEFMEINLFKHKKVYKLL